MFRLNLFYLGLFCISLVSVIQVFGQPSCSPVITNGSCLTGTTLVVGDPCVGGTTCGGDPEVASSCLFAGSECAWYSFVASSTDMFVNIDVSNTNGCHISSNVYQATGACIGDEISCLAGFPLSDVHSLSGLLIGTTYYIQVCYPPGGPCGITGIAEYCIEVGESDIPCATCDEICGEAIGYSSIPSLNDVVQDCETSSFLPELQPGIPYSYCYSFVAIAALADLNIVITSTCGIGNVMDFSWELYNYPACGPSIQSGTLADLSYNGLMIGNTYAFCYSFTVPPFCTHAQHCPYFVSVPLPLPISLLSFTATVENNERVNLEWATATELNNDYFTVERSQDASQFEAIAFVESDGNSMTTTSYQYLDPNPYVGTSYYRLKQTDLNGEFTLYNTVSVDIRSTISTMSIHPIPLEDLGQLTFNSEINGRIDLKIYDLLGRVVMSTEYDVLKGTNEFTLQLGSFTEGMYVALLRFPDHSAKLQFIKGK